MRILVYSESFAPDLISTGKYTGEMAAWLARKGHEVTVVTTPPHYPQWRVLQGYSAHRFSREKIVYPESTGTLEIVRCPVWIPLQPRGWKRILYLGSFALSSLPAILMQAVGRPDVILMIEPTFFCAPATLLVARLSKATSWLHIQDFEVDVAFRMGDFSSNRWSRFAQRIERFVMSKFDCVSAISLRMVEQLPGKGVTPDKTKLFPNWVDTSMIFPSLAHNQLKQELKVPPNTIVALYSGNMGMKQGLQLLVDASVKLASRPGIQFVFCGDGPYREVLLELSKRLSNVSLLPLQPADRLNDLLNLADIHLLPQLPEAADLVMPSKLTGIMASGRPVVATAEQNTQIANVVQGRGIVAPPGDVEAFVSAIILLASDPGLRRELGQQARLYAVAHMDQNQILGQFELSLMESCLPPAFSNENLESPDSIDHKESETYDNNGDRNDIRQTYRA